MTPAIVAALLGAAAFAAGVLLGSFARTSLPTAKSLIDLTESIRELSRTVAIAGLKK